MKAPVIDCSDDSGGRNSQHPGVYEQCVQERPERTAQTQHNGADIAPAAPATQRGAPRQGPLKGSNTQLDFVRNFQFTAFI